MTRKALGRGLSALLDDTQKPASDLQQIPIDSIDPNPFQPRRVIVEERLKELADSIVASGVVQPVVVRKSGDRYQLIAGERRWRAARLANLESIPAVIRDLADREALEVALTENLLREDLSSIETARAYQTLHEKFGHSHEDIAARLGLDRSTITNTLRLLKLPLKIQEMIESNKLSQGHARAVLMCASAEAQVNLAEHIAKHGLSVRQAERLAATSSVPETSSENKASTEVPADPNIRAAVLELERTLGTRVKIAGDGARGRIEISYYSSQDLNRLYDWIVRK
ncbi:MAG TPA: ParB/RepB/Spo0J family partition protein [Terriglobia bacterium]|nr:ParB/RepB/Spo0J family partition protein [Terriglobia bacterium]